LQEVAERVRQRGGEGEQECRHGSDLRGPPGTRAA
jgi:hypothetical protein